MTALSVLHIEDQERDVALITRHLSRAGYEVTSDRVDTPEAMMAALETREWDVILCDYTMPHFNALQALALMKTIKQDIPFIIIIGEEELKNNSCKIKELSTGKQSEIAMKDIFDFSFQSV